MLTFGEPACVEPEVPQCIVVSPVRIAGFWLMNTVPEPFTAIHMLGPQQTAWMPTSCRRMLGIAFTFTLGEPTMAGPIAGCGQPGQPWASAEACARSPRRNADGILA